ncbi:MAG: hypothetical protein ACE5HE_12325 [Phycisphaerae bacterium]
MIGMTVTIQEAGKPQPLFDHMLVTTGSVDVDATDGNAAAVYIGDELVSATLKHGRKLAANDTLTLLPGTDLSTVYIDGTAGDSVRWTEA